MVKKKLQLHQTNGKLQHIPKSAPTIASTSSSSTVLDADPNSEISQKFELELCWCIQQIQNSLKSGKLNPKQTAESAKILNTLMSTSSPIIKKRQVMRMAFGDYRAKMQAEEKKYQTQSIANRIQVKPVIPSKNSVFLKKSLFASTSGKDFKFNFPLEKDIPDVSSINIHADDSIKLESLSNTPNTEVVPSNDTTKVGSFSYVSSDNSFKFNFAIRNE